MDGIILNMYKFSNTSKLINIMGMRNDSSRVDSSCPSTAL
jgi:hypothetical protein